MNRYESEITKTLSKFPDLVVTEESKQKSVLEGKIHLEDKEFGGVYDTYQIRIILGECYPYCFPKVFELEEKIPRNPSRHVNQDGSLCLGVIQQELLITRRGIGLVEFIDRIVKPHLSRETYREIKGVYPHGEYSHGWKGILEFFLDVFKTDNTDVVMRILNVVINNKLPDRLADKCVCGNQRKYRKCHRIAIESILVLGIEYLEKLYFGLKIYLDDQNSNL